MLLFIKDLIDLLRSLNAAETGGQDIYKQQVSSQSNIYSVLNEKIVHRP